MGRSPARQVLDKPPFVQVAAWLEEPPAVLYQTYKQDHAPAREMCERHIGRLRRIYVDDEQCVADVVALGGAWLKEKYESYQRGSHRCDMWRYIRLRQNGGNYLDIKMALARPWAETLQAILAAGDQTAEGRSVAQTCQMARQSVAQPLGPPAAAGSQSVAQTCQMAGQSVAQPSVQAAPLSLATTPYLVMSIGANKRHIYQGNIWHASKSHPLLTHAVQKVLTTSQASLRSRYLLFCEQLWEALAQSLPQGIQPGWNFSVRWGPIYLFEKVLHKGYTGPKGQLWTDSCHVSMPVDGHFMHLAGGREVYAATRAWHWQHGFKEVVLAVADAKQAFANAATEAGQEAAAAEAGGEEIKATQLK